MLRLNFANTTSCEALDAQGDAKSYTIMITYNGVGAIITQSIVVPIVSNKYTIRWSRLGDIR